MDKALEIVVNQIREKRGQVVTAVSNGVGKDFAEYRALCGEMKGLSLAEGYILDLAHTMEQSDE